MSYKYTGTTLWYVYGGVTSIIEHDDDVPARAIPFFLANYASSDTGTTGGPELIDYYSMLGPTGSTGPSGPTGVTGVTGPTSLVT